jgi:hypothetical protein
VSKDLWRHTLSAAVLMSDSRICQHAVSRECYAAHTRANSPSVVLDVAGGGPEQEGAGAAPAAAADGAATMTPAAARAAARSTDGRSL